MYDVSSPPNFTPESHCFSKKSRAQIAVPCLKTEDFVASQVLRNLLIVQNEDRPRRPQIRSKVRQRVSQRGAWLMQDCDGPEPRSWQMI